MKEENIRVRSSDRISLISMLLNNIFAVILALSLFALIAIFEQGLKLDKKSYLEEGAFVRDTMDKAYSVAVTYSCQEAGRLLQSLDDDAPIPIAFGRMEAITALEYLAKLSKEKDPEKRLEEAKKFMEDYRSTDSSLNYKTNKNYGKGDLDHEGREYKSQDIFYRKKELSQWFLNGFKKEVRPSYLEYRGPATLFYLKDEEGEALKKLLMDRETERLRDEELEAAYEEDYVKILKEDFLPIAVEGTGKNLLEISNNDLNYYRELVDCLENMPEVFRNYLTSSETSTIKAGNLSYEIKFLSTGNTYILESEKEGANTIYSAPIQISRMMFTIGDGIWNEELSEGFSTYSEYSDSMLAFNDIELTMKIDSKLQVNDDLRDKILYYPRLQKVYKWIILTALISFIGWLVSLCLLLAKTRNDNYPLLKKFEGVVPLEIYIFISSIFMTLLVFVAFSIIQHLQDAYIWTYVKDPFSQGIWIFAGLIFLAFNMIGLYLLSAFFRKARQGRFIKGSLIWYWGRLIGGIWKIVAEGRAKRYRLSLLYISWLLAFGLLSFLIIIIFGNVIGPLSLIILFLSFLAGPLYIAYKKDKEDARLIDYLKEISAGKEADKPSSAEMTGANKEMLDEVNDLAINLRSSLDESLRNERLQTDLITNVSHDLRTPLTSIISYVDLLKSGDLSDEEKNKYLDILSKKADRLKILMNDLIEVSRASSGAVEIDEDLLDFSELFLQVLAEMSEGWEKKDLEPVVSLPEDSFPIMTDGAKLSRIIENFISNAQNYSQAGTRVYMSLEKEEHEAVLVIKNTSANPLNISPSEMMERFRRSDTARTSEGSGLGLSIAKNLSTKLNIKMELKIEADLFMVILRVPLLLRVEENQEKN